jgi:hypothetical protein
MMEHLRDRSMFTSNFRCSQLPTLSELAGSEFVLGRDIFHECPSEASDGNIYNTDVHIHASKNAVLCRWSKLRVRLSSQS